jgi:predicted nucleic acid-binding protein
VAPRLVRGLSTERELDELFERSGFKTGAEALQAFRDLFSSDEEMEEFGLYIQQLREEERARYRAASTQRRGRPRPLNDTWIAACAIDSALPLLTLNRRDFADFAEHDGLLLLG